MKNILSILSKFFKGEKGTGRALIAWTILVSVIAIAVFLIDSKNTMFSGWQIVKNQTAGEWFRMIFFSALAGITIWGFIRISSKTQDVKSGTITVFALALMLFLGIAFGKSCTDKVNDGVTSGSGRPAAAAVDSSRVPAEDLLPKK